MDLAPLTIAQNTARNAASSDQHEIAAQEYSVAARGIEDTEALRILSLLQNHHQHLARIVKAHSTPRQASGEVFNNQKSLEAATVDSESAPSPDTSLSRSPSHGGGRRPPSPVLQRRPAKDVSSTIASDLATARGIPNTQQRNARQASPVSSTRGTDGRASSRQHKPSGSSSSRAGSEVHAEDSAKQKSTRPSQILPSAGISNHAHVRQDSTGEQNMPTVKDDAFQKFYSTFEGLLSKISAPLAFAGLPLGPEQQTQNGDDKANAPSRAKSPEVTSDGPDVTKLFSKAALRAVKEENPGFGGIQESFLVVPTGGGTVSYAGILSRQERHARQHSMEQPLDADGDTAEKFVDARSSPQSRSPKESRRISASQSRSTKKTWEELELENESLKQLTDNLSRRLYMWEKSAQSQSQALQQSIRTLQPPAQTLQDGATELTVDARLRDLEGELASAKKEMQKYERENEKLKTVVARYRERWEKLKEGARVRREGTDNKSPVDPVQNET